MEPQLLTIELNDYLNCYERRISDYNLIGVEHSGRHRVGSGANLPPINRLEESVRNEFIKRLPSNTEVVVGVEKDIKETPSAFFSEGLQYVCYIGTALVPKE
ncbi:MAG: hypothetical protein KJ674_00480 [Nanoarchaeota archaeon]|nr:hypothetical protein [Nanoarchaeota archaeon]